MSVLAAGFADPVHESQACFRAVLTALSEPGTIATLPSLPGTPPGLDPAAAAICLALIDLDTPLWLDPAADRPEIRDWLRFHCGAPILADSRAAHFALILAPGVMPALDAFDRGSDELPEAGATLILQVPGLHSDRRLGGLTLSGPGIADRACLGIDGLAQGFWEERGRQARLFPRGLDLILASGDRIAALPRTTLVEA